MTLKAVLTSDEFDGLDESLQGHYVESRSGSYVLDADGIDRHPKVSGAIATLRKFQEAGGTDANGLKAKLEEADALKQVVGDMDVDALREALEKASRADPGDTGEGDHQRALQDALNRQKEKLEGSHKSKLDEKDAEIASLTDYIETEQRNSSVVGNLKGKVLDGTEESVALLLLNKHQNRIAWETVNGQRKPRLLFVNDLGEEEPADLFVGAWLKSDAAKPFLPGSGNNGTGTKGDGPGGGQANPWKDSTFNLTEQARIYRENPAMAKKLAAAAGKKLE